MARDTELDRLKAAQDLAFQRKQRAYETMQAAWQRRSSARDEMNRAFEVKQCAHEVQEASWRDYQRVKRANGPRIDQLNSQQESAYQNMRRAFDNASMAYDRRDGAAARSHADDGHAFKAEARRCVEERRRLVAEIRAARDRHAGPKADFQRAKADFTAAKQRFDQAKAEHERAKDEFQRAKREFDAARQAFKACLDKVRAERNRRREDKRAIAERAGVPSQYLDDLWVSRDSNGNTNIYFGGVGKSNGPGHGHYVIDRNGRVTYRRNPNDPHGSQNFQHDPALESRLTQTALKLINMDRIAMGPRSVQYHDGTVTVKVKSGYDVRTDTVITDVIIIDRAANPNEHLHLGISEIDGSIIFQNWNKNH